jgi:23S rRNA (adenine2503-C2)-methyltransferase
MLDRLDPVDTFDPFGLPYPALERRVLALGGAPVHALRWFRALHRAGVADPRGVFELGRALTARLEHAIRPRLPVVEACLRGADGTLKLGLRLTDGVRVESVLIPDGRRLTLCVSSQAGCAVGCGFCATGRQGLTRNLSAGEIVGQFIAARTAWATAPGTAGEAPGGRDPGAAGAGRITNLVFMGMGEPLRNWPAVRAAVEILHAPNGHNFSRDKITISTSGILPRLADVVLRARTGLALSLHATRDEERSRLIPVNRVYPLAEVMAELKRLALHHGGRTMIQYLLLEGENDSPRHARELWDWVRDFPCHINLLQYNPVPGLDYRRPGLETVRRFKTELLALGARVYHRESRGGDIAGACGQLAPAARAG